MLNVNECKKTASLLAAVSKKQLKDSLLDDFNEKLNQLTEEYQQKYLFSSSAINLQALKSFKEWLPTVIESKDLLVPIIVDKMVNNRDLYSLSLYQAIYKDTDLIPNVSEFEPEYLHNGGGENALALITGCYWISQQNSDSYNDPL